MANLEKDLQRERDYKRVLRLVGKWFRRYGISITPAFPFDHEKPYGVTIEYSQFERVEKMINALQKKARKRKE